MAKYERKVIPLSQLLLDPENARHGVKNTQAEIIEWMLSEIKDKIYNLAKDIVEHEMSPIDGVLIYPYMEDEGYYVVAEGNRRMTALLLLHDVERCPDEAIKRKLKQLKENPIYLIPDQIECVIAEDFESTQHWVRLRHGGEHEGRGTVQWGPVEDERFNRRIGHTGDNAIALKALDWAKENGLVTHDDVTNFPITNLTRLLNDSEVRKIFGLSVERDALQSSIDDVEIGKVLKRMILDLASSDVKVDHIKDKGQRERYAKKVAKETSFDSSKKAAIPVVLDGDPENAKTSTTGAVGTTSTTRQKQNSLDRKKLIPRVVSYDNAKTIRKLYAGCHRIIYGIQYSAGEHYEGSELICFSPSLIVPKVKNPLLVTKEVVCTTR